MLYRSGIRPLLSARGRDPERIQDDVLRLIAWASGAPSLVTALQAVSGGRLSDPRLARQVFGLSFPTPIGLAAGFDKNGVAVPALAALGFGFLEIGTLTLHAQPRNPRPPLFRLPAHAALINRMGFNKQGTEALAGQ